MSLTKRTLFFLALTMPILSHGKESLLKTFKDNKTTTACYARVYTDDEVGSSNSTYPDKIVKNIEVQFDLSGPETVLSLTALLNGKTENSNVNLNMICEDNTAGDELTHCTTAQGDAVIVELRENGKVLKLTNDSISTLSKQNRSQAEIFRMSQIDCDKN